MTRIVRLIGDVHNKYRQYKRIIKSSPYPSIQVGDIGLGFRWIHGWKTGRLRHGPPFYAMIEGPHEFIRGNHDNPGVCKGHKMWIPDGTIRDDIMFIGGAVSTDRDSRLEDYSWWRNEEPSITDLMIMVDVYATVKPRIMITHECPEATAAVLCTYRGREKLYDGSKCRQAFQSMFEIHKPRLWVHGHWHVRFSMVIEGTRFICLNELDYIDVDLDTLDVINWGNGYGGKK